MCIRDSKIDLSDLEEWTEDSEPPRVPIRGLAGFGSTGINSVAVKSLDSRSMGCNFGAQLTLNQIKKLQDLLGQFRSVMATSFEEIRVAEPQYYHHIDTGNHQPIKMH